MSRHGYCLMSRWTSVHMTCVTPHVKKCPSKPAGANSETRRTWELEWNFGCDVRINHVSTDICRCLEALKCDERWWDNYGLQWLLYYTARPVIYNKHGQDPTKGDYIRQKLREIGRLLLTLRKKILHKHSWRCHSTSKVWSGHSNCQESVWFRWWKALLKNSKPCT